MPLVALHDGERVVSTTLNIDEARQLARGTFTCPGCEEDMHPKRIRATGTQFFAHYAKGTCAHGLGESPAHLHLKEFVHDIAVGAGWTAEYEVRIDTPKGIAVIDVLLSHPTREKQKAVEIQLSRQTDAEYIQRSRTYATQGIETLWLTRHTAPERKDVTAVQMRKKGKETEVADIHELGTTDVIMPIRIADTENISTSYYFMDELLWGWMHGELTYHYYLELNPRVAYTPQGVRAVITDTHHSVWIPTCELKHLAQAHRDAKKDLALHKQVKKQVENQRKYKEQRRIAREAKVAEMRKQRVADEIQAAVDRGKALQKAHRMASPPTPWKDRVQAWLDAPVPDDIGETLDRLSEVYNAQKEAP